ncbi:MAG: EF-P lysine aminoacylase GenX, partial [Halioglobus sp.]|nr:EF-P lysine aminoacylase GenX [Halioglobus sp.]
MSWQPRASLSAVRRRARLVAQIREFFFARDVLEVDTPLLCSSGVTDPALEPLLVERGESLTGPRYLQTSPEYAMKRLLAAFGVPVYQIAKAFRDGEAGRRHNPEFT